MISAPVSSSWNVMRQLRVIDKLQVPLRIAGELMGFPARHHSQLGCLLHVLEEGDYLADFRHGGGRKARAVVMFDEAPHPAMDHVPDLHGGTWEALMYPVKLQKTPRERVKY
jgi:hypothetical protein